jgi:hypothetical protein
MQSPLSKDAVKLWLKRNNLPRTWLAEQCHVSKQSVDTWLSKSRPFPRRAAETIRKLMEKAPASPHVEFSAVHVGIDLPPELFSVFAWKAKNKGCTVAELVLEVLSVSADCFNKTK